MIMKCKKCNKEQKLVDSTSGVVNHCHECECEKPTLESPINPLTEQTARSFIDICKKWTDGGCREDSPYVKILESIKIDSPWLSDSRDAQCLSEQFISDNKTLVILESPYAGDVEFNLNYARKCLKDSLTRGESPIASHLLHTQVLNDCDPTERALGIDAGLDWLKVAEKQVFYTDLGWSEGMKEARKAGEELGIKQEERSIYK